MCKHNPQPAASPEGLHLPVEVDQIEAARETQRENKGAQWSACVAVGIQVGDNVELRNNLIPLLVEFDLPTSTIADMFGLSGREVWNIAASEPVSLFWCGKCGKQLGVRDRRDLTRLRRASRALSYARPGDLEDTILLCNSCTNLQLQLHSEEQRLRRLARQARTAQLRTMPFAEYRMQPEWQVRRVQALTRARYRCQMCSSHDATLDVHHNSYQNYGDERPEDLVVLCRSCHQKFHGIVEDAS